MRSSTKFNDAGGRRGKVPYGLISDLENFFAPGRRLLSYSSGSPAESSPEYRHTPICVARSFRLSERATMASVGSAIVPVLSRALYGSSSLRFSRMGTAVPGQLEDTKQVGAVVWTVTGPYNGRAASHSSRRDFVFSGARNTDGEDPSLHRVKRGHKKHGRRCLGHSTYTVR